MPVIDLTFLRSFTGDSPEKLNKYVTLFLQHTPQVIRNIESHLAGGDWAALRSSAHSLKPQISYMGIKSCEALIKSIEQNAGNMQNLEQLPQQIEELKKILDQAYPELREFISR